MQRKYKTGPVIEIIKWVPGNVFPKMIINHPTEETHWVIELKSEWKVIKITWRESSRHRGKTGAGTALIISDLHGEGEWELFQINAVRFELLPWTLTKSQRSFIWSLCVIWNWNLLSSERKMGWFVFVKDSSGSCVERIFWKTKAGGIFIYFRQCYSIFQR